MVNIRWRCHRRGWTDHCTLEQYAGCIGAEIKLQLRVKFENRRNFKGVVTAVENDEVVLTQDDEQITLPFELIEKANVVSHF